MIKPRNFDDEAWDMMRLYGAPGDLAVAKKSLERGYALGILDATKRLSQANDKISEEKRKSNAPR